MLLQTHTNRTDTAHHSIDKCDRSSAHESSKASIHKQISPPPHTYTHRNSSGRHIKNAVFSHRCTKYIQFVQESHPPPKSRAIHLSQAMEGAALFLGIKQKAAPCTTRHTFLIQKTSSDWLYCPTGTACTVPKPQQCKVEWSARICKVIWIGIDTKHGKWRLHSRAEHRQVQISSRGLLGRDICPLWLQTCWEVRQWATEQQSGCQVKDLCRNDSLIR